MKLTRKQEIKLRLISDGWLYNEAQSIAKTSKGYSEILKFINHQASKDHREIKQFYSALKKKFDELIKNIKDNRDFVPDNLFRKQLRNYTEFFGLLFVREFIHHLSAEHRYQSEDA